MDTGLSRVQPAALLVLLLIAALVSTACSTQSTPTPGGSPVPQSTQAPAGQATKVPGTQTAQVPTVQPSATAKATTPTVGTVGGFGKVASLDELNAYRMKMTSSTKKSDGTQSAASVTTMESVKSPPSRHFAMGEGASAVEIITIGDKTWMKLSTMGWIESPPGQQQSVAKPPEVPSYIYSQDINTKLLGSETVNGVNCKHYSYAGTSVLTDPRLGKITSEAKGETWIADQLGLPAVLVRTKSESTMTGGNLTAQGEIMYMQMDVTDINGAISIKPPEGATLIGVPPTATGGKGTPTRVVTPSAGKPTPSAALAACFKDFPAYPGAAPDAEATSAARILTLASPGRSEARGYATGDVWEDVQAYYESEAPGRGWELAPLQGGAAEGGVTMFWGNAKYLIHLIIAPGKDDNGSQIIMACFAE